MNWYENHYHIEDAIVTLTGSFEESKIIISTNIKLGSSNEFSILYEKPVNMWVDQEILAEDILSRYQGMIKKCEKKLSTLVQRAKLALRWEEAEREVTDDFSV